MLEHGLELRGDPQTDGGAVDLGDLAKSMHDRTIRVRSSSNSSSSIPSRNVRSAVRGDPSCAGTSWGGGTWFLSPSVSMSASITRPRNW